MRADLTTERGVRHAARTLGIATAAFGIWPTVAPACFGRLFGMPTEGSPAVQAAIRSLGIRDLVTGIGLISAAMHGGKLGPWLLTRTLIDGGDALTFAMAYARGRQNPRLAALTVLAFSAAMIDHALWHAARRAAD